MEAIQLNAVLFTKTASEKTREMSIDTKVDSLRAYATEKGFRILRIFSLANSSMKVYKEKSQEMMDYIKKQKGYVVLIVDTIDRVQGNFKNLMELDTLLKAREIEIHLVKERMILNKDSKNYELLTWELRIVDHKRYASILNEDSKRLGVVMLKSGQWIGYAPIGYINVKASSRTKKANIVVDETRSHLVKKCFELYATGKYSISDIAIFISKEGLTNPISGKPLSVKQIECLLKNPFYYGIMRFNGIAYPHKYSPIIDKELYLQCQKQFYKFLDLL